MKTKCDFCKTEYSIEQSVSGPVKCAICGHVWNVTTPVRKNSWLMLFAAICALLSAVIFTIVAIAQHQIKKANQGPLIANIANIETTTDESGETRLVVNGTITNISEQIYGVPDLIIISTDNDNNVLAKQKFMPSATLLDAGSSVNFKHVLSAQPNGVKKITAKLVDFEIAHKDKK
jgi:predicted Zn finger-like uncharacterized protein